MEPLALLKVAGSLITVGAGIWGLLTLIYSASRAFHDTRNTFRETRDTVKLLATNHLPHIQESLNKQDVAIEGLRSNVRNLDTSLADHVKRFEDTKNTVDRINDAFIAKVFKN